MHQDYDEESTQQVYEHGPEGNDINSYTSERQEEVLSGSSDTQHEVKQEIQKPPLDRNEYFQHVSRVISTQVGETIPQERVNEIVDYASHQLIYSPFGLEGTRDIMAITAATLANPTEAQKVLNHITGLHIDDTTPIDRRYEVSTTALTRLGLSGIKDEDLHNVLALVSTPLGASNREQTLQHLVGKVGTQLSLDTPPEKVRQVVGNAYEQLAGRLASKQGAAEHTMAVIDAATFPIKATPH